MNKLFLVAFLFAGASADLCASLKTNRDAACAAKEEPRCADAQKAVVDECPKAPAALPKPTAKPTPAPAPKECPTKTNDCHSTNDSCHGWAKAGECMLNGPYMNAECSSSCCDICQVCPDEKHLDECVADKDSRCEKWAKDGECDKNFDWMHANCQSSCCPSCPTTCPLVRTADCHNEYDDKHEDAMMCQTWALAMECSKNPVWMTDNCQKECCPLCMAAPMLQTLRAPIQTFAPLRQPLLQNYTQALRAPVRQAVNFAPLRQNYTQFAPVRQAATLPYTGFANPSYGSYNSAYGNPYRFG